VLYGCCKEVQLPAVCRTFFLVQVMASLFIAVKASRNTFTMCCRLSKVMVGEGRVMDRDIPEYVL
jgi:hypothetical protein